MTRTELTLTDEQLRFLRSQAEREGLSVSEVLRRILDPLIPRREEPEVPSTEQGRERALRAVGKFASGDHDIAENHDDYLAEAFGS